MHNIESPVQRPDKSLPFRQDIHFAILLNNNNKKKKNRHCSMQFRSFQILLEYRNEIVIFYVYKEVKIN